MMTERERFRRYVRFQGVDRPPRWEWAFRHDTTQLWRQQGLPDEVPTRCPWYRYFELDRGAPFVDDGVPTDTGVAIHPIPSLAGARAEDDGLTVITTDGWGATSRSLKAGIQSIPQYHGFFVRDRESFRELRAHLDPADPRRLPADWATRVTAWRTRDYPLRFHTHGWYGFLRAVMGLEGLSFAFFDQPALVAEMTEFWADFVTGVANRVLADVTPDYVLFWEDLAFKTGPLLSPAQFRRFLLPHYRRVIDHFRAHGVDTFMVDSDGCIDAITPLWLEAGISILGPYEVSAGMDVARTGREYPELVMVGGLDKIAIARGPQAIEAEVRRCVPPLLERGGYIPTLDHATIPELSLADYRLLRNRLHQAMEGSPA